MKRKRSKGQEYEERMKRANIPMDRRMRKIKKLLDESEESDLRHAEWLKIIKQDLKEMEEAEEKLKREREERLKRERAEGAPAERIPPDVHKSILERLEKEHQCILKLMESDKALNYGEGGDEIARKLPLLHIFKEDGVGRFFLQQNLVLETKSSPSKFERHLKKARACRPRDLENHIAGVEPSMLDNPIQFLDYLFKMASTHRDAEVAQVCGQTIKKLVDKDNKNRIEWCPSLHDILVIFFNFGMDINVSCPIPEEILNIVGQLSISMANNHSGTSAVPVDWSSLAINFKSFLNIIKAVLENTCRFSVPELRILTVLLLWVPLDRRFKYAKGEVTPQCCAAVALEAIPQQNWTQELKRITQILCSLGSDHHRRNHKLIRSLSGLGNRMGILQTTAAYVAAVTMLGIRRMDYGCGVKVCNIISVLTNIGNRHAELAKDCCRLNTIAKLIDICVFPLIRITSEKKCWLLIRMVRLLYGALKDANFLSKNVCKMGSF